MNQNKKIPVKEAKDIFKKFKINTSRIACQLLIKQNTTFHFTNIACDTHILQESEWLNKILLLNIVFYLEDQKKTTKKRSANAIDSDDEESLYERPSTSKSKSAKRKKRYSNF
jgi:hypothetical protein